jgi:hypothetical protein
MEHEDPFCYEIQLFPALPVARDQGVKHRLERIVTTITLLLQRRGYPGAAPVTERERES